MTTRRKLATLALALIILAALTLACTDDWDGMDRDEWHKGPTATFAVQEREPWPPPPPGGNDG